MKENKRKVTAEEVEELYKFTRRHYVEYYDLQTELVDHLANGIEQRWAENPHLDFEENLQKEFKKFGVFGFSDIVKEREKAMTKRYWKLIWQETKQQLCRLPILLSAAALTVLLIYFRRPLVFDIVLILIFLQSIYFFVKTYHIRKKVKTKKKVYLFEKIITQGSGFNIGFIYVWVVLNPTIGLTSNDQIGVLFSCFWALLISLVMVANYVTLYVLPNKKEEIMAKIHPERKLSFPARQ